MVWMLTGWHAIELALRRALRCTQARAQRYAGAAAQWRSEAFMLRRGCSRRELFPSPPSPHIAEALERVWREGGFKQ
eukprot:3890752-Pleurochrysis_carterae.AAC.1